VSRPLVSALASAFLRRPRRISADLTGQRALETPKGLPAEVSHYPCKISSDASSTRRSSQSIAVPSLPVFPSVQILIVHLCVRSRGSLTLSGASSGTGVAAHGNGLLVVEDVAKVGEGALKLPSVDGLGGLAGVLERNTEVGAASAGALCVVEVGCSVTNLRQQLISHSRLAAAHLRALRRRAAATHHFGGR
jgi:hypothetical protein